MRRSFAVTTGAVGAGVLAATLLAGCGSNPAVVTTSPSPASAVLPIATSQADPAGASWAAVELGGARARHDNFWELFVRRAKASSWQVVTPAGTASNGGVITANGGISQFAAFRPSQNLTFSPLAATTNQGNSWSRGTLVSPGLADAPNALAGRSDGQLLALSYTGTVRLGARDGASWRSVASRDSLARSQAGRACGLASLSAVAFSGAGTPLLGGSCRTPGAAGLFAFTRGGWQSVGPVLHVGPASLASQSLWPGGAAGLVLAGWRGETIAGPGSAWRLLAPLPDRTATLALGPAGQLEALAARGATLTAWKLGAGSGVTPASAGSRPASWDLLQAIKVPIPYGSSG